MRLSLAIAAFLLAPDTVSACEIDDGVPIETTQCLQRAMDTYMGEYPKNLEAPKVILELGYSIKVIKDFRQGSTDKYTITIKGYCENLSTEVAEINLAVTKQSGGAPTEEQKKRRQVIDGLLRYCAWPNSGMVENSKLIAKYRGVITEYDSKSKSDLEWMVNRYKNCLYNKSCKSGEAKG